MKKSTNHIEIPRLEDVDPAYAKAKELVTTLKTKAAALAAEEADIIHRLTHRPAGVEVTTRVARLLGDDGPEDDAAPDGLQKRLQEITVDRADYRRAIEEAERREASARYAASAKICGEVKAAYSAAVEQVAQSLIAAHQAHTQLLQIVDALTQRDVAWTGHLAPMQADRIFGARVPGWLREAATAGYIKPSIIPEGLKV